MPDGTLTPDLCVIGGSSAGAYFAALAAPLGLSTLLIVPKRGPRRPARADLAVHAFAAAAQRVHDTRRAPEFGIAAEPAVDFARLREHALGVVADLARNESAARLAALGVGVIEADARFVDPKSLTADGMEIRARRFVLAPEQTPFVPEIRGLARVPHATADTIFDHRECPGHLLVVGSGATGLTIAQTFRRLGAEVTVLDAAAPLSGEDPECANIVVDELTREGIVVRGHVEIERVEGRKGLVRLTLAGNHKETIEGTHLMFATGRRPALQGYGLELAGIAYSENGVDVTDGLRTTNSRVFAIGAARRGAGAPERARWQGRLIVRNLLLRMPIRTLAAQIPRVVATDPALAHVGLREEAARSQYRKIRVLRAPFFENERAVIERENKGTIKLVTTASGRLLGATIAGAGAGELIGVYALAIARRMNVRALAGPLFAAPTRAEIGQAAALGGMARGLSTPWPRRLINFVRLFD